MFILTLSLLCLQEQILFSLEYYWLPLIIGSSCLSAVDFFHSLTSASSFENTQKWKIGIFLLHFFKSATLVMENNFWISNMLRTTYLLFFWVILFVLIITIELWVIYNCNTKKVKKGVVLVYKNNIHSCASFVYGLHTLYND